MTHLVGDPRKESHLCAVLYNASCTYKLRWSFYRPPSAKAGTSRSIELSCANALHFDMDVFILGDIKINLFKQLHQPVINSLLNIGYNQRTQ